MCPLFPHWRGQHLHQSPHKLHQSKPEGDQGGQDPRGGEVDQQAVSHHEGEGGVNLEEAVKNSQEEDNAASSAVIDVGEVDSVDEVLVATSVEELINCILFVL
jgi:hypothetical protein